MEEELATLSQLKLFFKEEQFLLVLNICLQNGVARLLIILPLYEIEKIKPLTQNPFKYYFSKWRL